MMTALSTPIALVWVVICLVVLAIGAPMAALAYVSQPGGPRPAPGTALVWTWLTLAVLVPAAAAVHAFNWVTALLMTAALPAALWWHHHRGDQRTAFRQTVHSLVFRLLEPSLGVTRRTQLRVAIGLALPVLTVVILAVKQVDVRLPVPADFDTFSRTRQLLEGTTAWDPLASLAAVLVRVAAADTLSVLVALRLALVAFTVGAVSLLLVEVFGPPVGLIGAPVALVVAVAFTPLATMAIALLLLIGATSLVRWFRGGSPREGWTAIVAALLAVYHVAPFADRPEVLFRVERAAHHLEHRAAPGRALWLAGQSADDDWVLVGPPEQRLEIDGRGRFYDLAGFVARFHARAGDAGFRFDLDGKRLFVLVEKHALDVSRPAPGIRFIETQAPAYRVPQERDRLQQMAMELCENYRLNHAGAEIVYDDAELRVYRFDV